MNASARFDAEWEKYCERIFGANPPPHYLAMGRACFYLGAVAAVLSFEDALELPEGEREYGARAVMQHILDEMQRIGANLAPELSKPRNPVQ